MNPRRCLSHLPRIGASSLMLSLAASRMSADVVIDWNSAMTHYNEGQPPPGMPPLELRAYAMAHIAMFDAIRAATDGRSNAEAAAARAAHDVLVKLLPGGVAEFDALLAKQLGAITDGVDKTAGVEVGARAATDVLAARANDGAATGEGPYQPGSRPGDYRFTPPFDGPPFNGYAHFPNLGKVTPFVLKSGAQFRSPPPYTLTDPEYAYDFNEVKALGARDSAVRTSDQTATARFYYESSGFTWNRAARILAAKQNDSLLDHARLFAALNAAMADTIIAGFDSKYAYTFWRPVTAIHRAANDGNDLTSADPAWEPLMLTPPMPDYPSTHSSVGAAAAVVLIWFFHGDDQTFTLSSTMSAQFPDLRPRTYRHISDLAVETALSRVFAGIHFRRACLAGLEQGHAVGTWVVQHAPYAQGH